MTSLSHLTRKITGWFLLPVVLAVPFSIVICFIIPEVSNKYRVEPVRQYMMNADSRILYEDMDNDGWSDYYYNGYYNGKAYVTVYSHDAVLDQWNFNGYFLQSGVRTISGDHDNDGIKEIYSFTYRNDSLFVTGINYPNIKEFPSGGRFLTYIPNAEGQGYTIHSAFLTDLNGDGFKEVVAGLTAGYELEPRRVFAWDIYNDRLIVSPDLGTGITNISLFVENGFPYFTASCYASTNYKDSARLLHDNSVYFLILDKNLMFKFKPVEFKGGHRGSYMQPLKNGDHTSILFMHSGDKSDPVYRLRICDTKGKTLHIKEYKQHQSDWYEINVVRSSKEDRILVVKYDGAELLDEKLKTVASIEQVLLGMVHDPCDIDKDGNHEVMLYTGKPGEYLISRSDLSHPVPLKLSVPGRIKKVNVVNRGNESSHFTVHADNMLYTFRYEKNPWHLLRYAVWAGVYLVILGFILLIRRMQRIQLKRIYEMKQRVTELKLQSIRNQMDPHFTFNVLNAIGSVILQNKPDESYSMLMKYSKLLRGTISASDKIWRTLEEEINLVKNYLELQKMRYHDMLSYQVDISEDVDLHWIVPKMVIQTYTENAIKHGILPKENGGRVLIKLSTENELLIIEVSDDGVGRKRAGELNTTNTGKGLEIMHECYILLNSLNDHPINEEFTDLYSADGIATGTRVIIKIPKSITVNQ